MSIQKPLVKLKPVTYQPIAITFKVPKRPGAPDRRRPAGSR